MWDIPCLWRENEREAIRETTRMLKEKFPVKEIILFGSKARGKSEEESDIDLFLMTKHSYLSQPPSSRSFSTSFFANSFKTT